MYSLKELQSWDIEKALEANENWKPNDDNLERFPIARWESAQALKVLEKIYQESKNPAVLLEALYFCALNDFVMPRWCALAYIKAFREVKGFRAKSWDDAFGRPHPKGTQLDAKRKQREKEFVVYRMVMERKPGDAIDGALFEKIGRQLGIGGKTLVEEYYYNVKKFLEDIKKIDN